MKIYEKGKTRIQKTDRPHWNGARWSEIKDGWSELEQGRYNHPAGTVLINAQCRHKMDPTEGWQTVGGHVSLSLHRGNGSGEEVYRFDQFKGVRPSVRKIVHQARLFLEENTP